MTVLDVRVGSGIGDGYVTSAGSTGHNETGTTLMAGESTTNTGVLYDAWFLFPNTSQLRAQFIDNAYIVSPRHTALSHTLGLSIYADDSAAPTAPTTDTGYFSKPLTSAFISWSISGVAASTITSPDITSVIQELVDAYPTTLSAIQLLVKSTNRTPLDVDKRLLLYGYENSSANATLLHVEYSEPVGGNNSAIRQLRQGLQIGARLGF